VPRPTAIDPAQAGAVSIATVHTGGEEGQQHAARCCTHCQDLLSVANTSPGSALVQPLTGKAQRAHRPEMMP
jgi:hypothetical protein